MSTNKPDRDKPTQQPSQPKPQPAPSPRSPRPQDEPAPPNPPPSDPGHVDVPGRKP